MAPNPTAAIADRDLKALAPTLAAGQYAFFDFGSGAGRALGNYERMLGGPGLGVEIDAAKVDAARAEGRNVVEGSLFDVPARPLVRFVTADNVLEHLSSIDEVGDALQLAATVAGEFVYLRHPSFEDEDHLRALGLSATWIHRSGHRAHVRLVDFAVMADRIGIPSWELHPVLDARDTTDDEIVPLGTPKNDLTYDPAKHAPKPEVTFARPVFHAFDLIFHLTPTPRVRPVYLDDPMTSLKRPRLVPIDSPTTAALRAGRRAARRAPAAVKGVVKKGLDATRGTQV